MAEVPYTRRACVLPISKLTFPTPSLLYEASEHLILSGNRSGREHIFDYILDCRSHPYAGTANTAGTGLHSASSSDECPGLFLLCHLPVGSCEVLALMKGALQFVWKLKSEHLGPMPSHSTLYQGDQCTQIACELFHPLPGWPVHSDPM